MKEVTLAECPPGLFVFDGTLCFKSAYYADYGSPDAYVVSSGKYFWGGGRDQKERDNLMVLPISGEEVGLQTQLAMAEERVELATKQLEAFRKKLKDYFKSQRKG
jgi:hypothetical protein